MRYLHPTPIAFPSLTKNVKMQEVYLSSYLEKSFLWPCHGIESAATLLYQAFSQVGEVEKDEHADPCSASQTSCWGGKGCVPDATKHEDYCRNSQVLQRRRRYAGGCCRIDSTTDCRTPSIYEPMTIRPSSLIYRRGRCKLQSD